MSALDDFDRETERMGAEARKAPTFESMVKARMQIAMRLAIVRPVMVAIAEGKLPT